jgi:hypothetical protein
MLHELFFKSWPISMEQCQKGHSIPQRTQPLNHHSSAKNDSILTNDTFLRSSWYNEHESVRAESRNVHTSRHIPHRVVVPWPSFLTQYPKMTKNSHFVRRIHWTSMYMIPDIISCLGIHGSYRLDRWNPFYAHYTTPDKDLVRFLAALKTATTVDIRVIYGRYWHTPKTMLNAVQKRSTWYMMMNDDEWWWMMMIKAINTPCESMQSPK